MSGGFRGGDGRSLAIGIARATIADRKSTNDGVSAHASEIRTEAKRPGLGRVRLRRDRTVVTHSQRSAIGP